MTQPTPTRETVKTPDGRTVAVPLNPVQEYVLHEWLVEHNDELTELLAPHGLHPNDIFRPKFSRVLYVDEAVHTDDLVQFAVSD